MTNAIEMFPNNKTQRVLLISNSTLHGSGYLDHAESEIRSFLGDAKRVLFVPYALFDRDKYAANVRQRFQKMGYELTSVHTAANPVTAIGETDAVFIGGGNTFRLLKALYDFDLIEAIRKRVVERNAVHRIERWFECRCADDQNHERHADRAAAVVQRARVGVISDQSSLSRSGSEFEAHGRDARRTDHSVSRGE